MFVNSQPKLVTMYVLQPENRAKVNEGIGFKFSSGKADAKPHEIS
jgi:hypothetical protein